jgi:xylose isomerase
MSSRRFWERSRSKGEVELETMKNSVGVWAFGPAVTRFVPPGYHPEVANEPMAEKTRRVAEGLSDILDGLEYHCGAF